MSSAACSGDGGSASSTTGDGSRAEAECPTTVDAAEFATADELHDLLAEFNAFGLRSPASEEHEAAI
ncbi:MAG: hypothetical protein ACYC2O_09685, partial [Microthrixaceae bacterium]